MITSFQVGDIHIGSGGLFLIAGPCVIESEEHALRMAEIIKGVAKSLNFPFIFKASYDKANRTSIRSFRGPGLKEGCRILKKIKKGQFVAPSDMRHAVEKCRDAGNSQVFLTERGASFGYNNLVVDMRSLAIMRKFAPVVFDATHSVQLPSSQSDGNGPAVSGGQPEFIPLLARAAVAAGVDGVFLEVHDNPKEAKSDGANALESTKLREVLKELLAVRQALEAARAAP